MYGVVIVLFIFYRFDLVAIIVVRMAPWTERERERER